MPGSGESRCKEDKSAVKKPNNKTKQLLGGALKGDSDQGCRSLGAAEDLHGNQSAIKAMNQQSTLQQLYGFEGRHQKSIS